MGLKATQAAADRAHVVSDFAAASVDQLLERMVELNASDLHLTAGSSPVVRLRGRLERLGDAPKLTPEMTQQMLYRILSTEQQKHLEVNRQIDLSHSIPGVARFRVNVYWQRESLAAAFRLIPTHLKTLEELGLPPSLHELAAQPRGLVLVTGPTGSGKSTTLASLIDEINRNRSDHIMTIEDPIEFLHQHKRCIVNQREIGPDATGFADALRAALRQDPDVILVGEMRDRETIGTALTAAETGHLVFATLHTQSAPQTIDRIIDVFPAEQQAQVRTQLAGTLQGIITQALLPTADGTGRVAALEILLLDDAVRNVIRQSKIEQVYSYMQTGTKRGMQTMEQSLADLIIRNVVTYDEALSRSSRKEELAGVLERSGFDPGLAYSSFGAPEFSPTLRVAGS
jgi:twitching motility protein PilT